MFPGVSPERRGRIRAIFVGAVAGESSGRNRTLIMLVTFSFAEAAESILHHGVITVR